MNGQTSIRAEERVDVSRETSAQRDDRINAIRTIGKELGDKNGVDLSSTADQLILRDYSVEQAREALQDEVDRRNDVLCRSLCCPNDDVPQGVSK
ncbi:MAG TPA: hypothetical protein VEK08_07145 [Planctomycetota bacterium]|nr:hypothetical protein [Planctomycetota bacterium]